MVLCLSPQVRERQAPSNARAGEVEGWVEGTVLRLSFSNLAGLEP